MKREWMASDDEDFMPMKSDEESDAECDASARVIDNPLPMFSVQSYAANTDDNNQVLKRVYGFESYKEMLEEFNVVRSLLLSILKLDSNYYLQTLIYVRF